MFFLHRPKHPFMAHQHAGRRAGLPCVARGLRGSWFHPWLADSGFRWTGGLPGGAPRGSPCGNAGTGRLLPEAFEFLRLVSKRACKTWGGRRGGKLDHF
jgi:hypothetical protein